MGVSEAGLNTVRSASLEDTGAVVAGTDVDGELGDQRGHECWGVLGTWEVFEVLKS